MKIKDIKVDTVYRSIIWLDDVIQKCKKGNISELEDKIFDYALQFHSEENHIVCTHGGAAHYPYITIETDSEFETKDLSERIINFMNSLKIK